MIFCSCKGSRREEGGENDQGKQEFIGDESIPMEEISPELEGDRELTDDLLLEIGEEAKIDYKNGEEAAEPGELKIISERGRAILFYPGADYDEVLSSWAERNGEVDYTLYFAANVDFKEVVSWYRDKLGPEGFTYYLDESAAIAVFEKRIGETSQSVTIYIGRDGSQKTLILVERVSASLKNG